MFNLDQLEEAQNTENTEREQTQENGAQEIKEVTLQIDVREQNTTNDSSKISTETKPETEGDK